MEKLRPLLIYKYFIAVVSVTIPFWVLGSITHVNGLPFNMQLNALLIFVLPIITSIFVYNIGGKSAVRQMWQACIPQRADFKVIAIAFISMPLLALLTFTVLRANGVIFDGFSVSLWQLPVYFLIYYIAAAFEEVGWTWLSTPSLLKKYGVISAGLIIGFVWSLIHVWPWFLQNGAHFMVGMGILSIQNRIIMTWMYSKSAAKLWPVIVYHAMINMTFTVFHFSSPFANPFLYSGVLILVAVCILILCLALKKRSIIKDSGTHIN